MRGAREGHINISPLGNGHHPGATPGTWEELGDRSLARYLAPAGGAWRRHSQATASRRGEAGQGPCISYMQGPCVLCESSRYATNPLWLLAADLHRSFAQAQKACSHESVLPNAPCRIVSGRNAVPAQHRHRYGVSATAAMRPRDARWPWPGTAEVLERLRRDRWQATGPLAGFSVHTHVDHLCKTATGLCTRSGNAGDSAGRPRSLTGS